MFYLEVYIKVMDRPYVGYNEISSNVLYRGAVTFLREPANFLLLSVRVAM
jgi:hypothetical protein